MLADKSGRTQYPSFSQVALGIPKLETCLLLDYLYKANNTQNVHSGKPEVGEQISALRKGRIYTCSDIKKANDLPQSLRGDCAALYGVQLGPLERNCVCVRLPRAAYLPPLRTLRWYFQILTDESRESQSRRAWARVDRARWRILRWVISVLIRFEGASLQKLYLSRPWGFWLLDCAG